jgi:hypothetical protein
VLAEVVDRAGHSYGRWAELVAEAGYCHHPIRLAVRVEQADQATGEVRTTVPWPGWSASRRASCGGWSASRRT